jgi:hypothetical protein
MFERRTKVTEYTREQTIRWLSWLARSLMHNNLSVFYLELAQPDWLPSRIQQQIMAMLPIVTMLPLLLLPVASVVVPLEQSGMRVWHVVYGSCMWLYWTFRVYRHGRRIEPFAKVRWSWAVARSKFISAISSIFSQGSHVFANTVIFNLVFGVVFFGLVGGLAFGLVFGLVLGLVFSLFWFPTFGMISMILIPISGVVFDKIAIQTMPNELIRRSLRRALLILLFCTLIGVLIGMLIPVLVSGLTIGLTLVGKHPMNTLLVGIFTGFIGMIVGLGISLYMGGYACLQHYILRFLLWRNDCAPWNYIRFLDYAAERIFLRKVGGGYIFTHRLLMEYFATLDVVEKTRQVEADQRQ